MHSQQESLPLPVLPRSGTRDSERGLKESLRFRTLSVDRGSTYNVTAYSRIEPSSGVDHCTAAERSRINMAPLYFRGAGYNKRVILGKRTIKAGEAAIIWNLQGQVRRHALAKWLLHTYLPSPGSSSR